MKPAGIMKYDKIDEAMFPFYEFVMKVSDINGSVTSEKNDLKMHIERVTIQMPVQMDIIVDEDGSVTLGSSPPLYYVDTTVLPVFHNIEFTTLVEKSKNY